MENYEEYYENNKRDVKEKYFEKYFEEKGESLYECFECTQDFAIAKMNDELDECVYELAFKDEGINEDFEEWILNNPEFREEVGDYLECQRDPYGYRGISEKDFY